MFDRVGLLVYARCFQEALRMFPTVPAFARVAKETHDVSLTCACQHVQLQSLSMLFSLKATRFPKAGLWCFRRMRWAKTQTQTSGRSQPSFCLSASMKRVLTI